MKKEELGFLVLSRKHLAIRFKAKEHIIDLNSKVADRKISKKLKKVILEADTNCKSLLKLKDKKKEEHLKIEIKKEETALEDIIGARFVFNQSTN